MPVKLWSLMRAFSSGGPNSTSRIIVRNVSWFTSEKDLENYFGRFGKVLNVKVVYDWETGLHKGFAFVVFECVNDALKAVQQIHLIDGRQVVARIAVPNFKKQHH